MVDNEVEVVFTADTSQLQSGVSTAIGAFDELLKTADISKAFRKQPITEMFQTLQSSSDRAIAGLIKGTESWGQAMSGIITAVEIKFVQLCANMLINAVESQLGITTATQQGDAVRAASDQTASTATSAARAQQAMATIATDAAETYGGVFAFLAPVMGPAAAGPAGAAEAQVMGQMGLVSLDVGAWNVPSDMPAYLHAGEMVVPQNFASGMRDGSGLGGGGDNYTININAIDTQTGTQFLKSNAAAIAGAISSQVRSFNRNLPAWKSG